MPMLRKTMGLALAGLLMMAPITMAAGTTGTTGAGQATPGTAGTQPGTQPGMAAMHTGFQATVEQIDRDDRKLHLRAEDGEKMELKVPQQVLAGLQQGDRVQVAIQKAHEGAPGVTPGAPGAPGARPAQPGQTR